MNYIFARASHGLKASAIKLILFGWSAEFYIAVHVLNKTRLHILVGLLNWDVR